MGWNDVSSNGHAGYVEFQDNKRFRIRLLLHEKFGITQPVSFWTHQIFSAKRNEGQSEQILLRKYKTQPCNIVEISGRQPCMCGLCGKTDPLWDFLLEREKYNRNSDRRDFPVRQVHMVPVYNYATGRVEILNQGNQLFTAFKENIEARGDAYNFDFEIEQAKSSKNIVKYTAIALADSPFDESLIEGQDIPNKEAIIEIIKNQVMDPDELNAFIAGEDMDPTIGGIASPTEVKYTGDLAIIVTSPPYQGKPLGYIVDHDPAFLGVLALTTGIPKPLKIAARKLADKLLPPGAMLGEPSPESDLRDEEDTTALQNELDELIRRIVLDKKANAVDLAGEFREFGKDKNESKPDSPGSWSAPNIRSFIEHLNIKYMAEENNK